MIYASIVVHKTSPVQLQKALDCLLASDIDKIYIIDNSPNDDLRKKIKKDGRISYIHTENNGFGAGHNMALKYSLRYNANYHLVMNADIWWENDIVGYLKDYMDLHPEIGLISPKIFYPDGDLQYSCRKLPSPLDLVLKRFFPKIVNRKRMINYLLEKHDHNFPINCPYLLGSFLFFRVDALKQKGLFDERFFMYPEDIDISRRLHESWKTIYLPYVSIIHEHQAASRKNMRMLWIHLSNMIKYFNKWGWFKDKKRKLFNKNLMKEVVELKEGEIQKGRG